MGREIKFRAWDKETNQVIHSDDPWFTKLAIFVLFRPDDRFDFMQYTGLKDKNGVEIYEGDVVDFFDKDISEYPFVVEWYQATCKFSITSEEELNGTFFIQDAKRTEVIGNIYEDDIHDLCND